MSKRGVRTAILIGEAVCVFRGEYLEHLFLDKEEFLRSSVVKEVNFSNFNLGKEYHGELEGECSRIVGLITKKLKKMEQT
ncbi:hypothetical protein [Metallosphaera hakonensis]|uniref:Uncharacterized protein n=1 Tax=Metallosphaera hakonensis JCM 8857 = DSM 7519 TaxID=1293036 RepID=A0A2U9IUT2_9CREN|nr:hypothetical protein [Metallosphaera hakonensis]AWR99851.1 hypothetical protein DFR87_09275 [Metallosphaera hakonensis JCM 8857 = DSM 7519]